MTITQKQAINAYKTIYKIKNQDMPGTKAKLLYDLRRILESQYQFQIEQEQLYIEQLGCDVDQNGSVSFPDVEARGKYLQKINELNAMEVEIDFTKKMFDISDIMLSEDDIESLDPVLDIVC